MNKNRIIVKTTCSGLAVATATSVLLGGIQYPDDVSAQSVLEDITIVDVREEESLYAGGAETANEIQKEVASEYVESPAEPEINWDLKLMANVRTTLNIRSEANINSTVVGKMRPTDMVDIIAFHDKWIEIESGELRGFVSADYAITGEEVRAKAEQFGKPRAVSKVSELNIRSQASTDSNIVGKLRLNQGLEIDNEAEAKEGWVGVKSDNFRGYVYGQYVEIKEQELTKAISLEEERAQYLESLQAQIAARPNVIFGEPVQASAEDEVLMAALLMCEAGSSFDGMLAVGGVVINRLKAGYAPTIYDVIYQRGQFTPAGSGKVAQVMANGVSDLALEAARQALSGIDITGGCKSFRAAWTGHAGTNIGGNVFF